MRKRRESDGAYTKIGRLIYELRKQDRDRQIRALGCPLKEWVPQNLVDKDGQPRTWVWAVRLSDAVCVMDKFPRLVTMCEAGDVSYTIARRLAEWAYKTNMAGGQGYPEADAKLCGMASSMTSKQIRDAIGQNPDQDRRKFLGGYVTPELVFDWRQTVHDLAKLTGDEIHPEMAFQEQAHLVTEFLRDTLSGIAPPRPPEALRDEMTGSG